MARSLVCWNCGESLDNVPLPISRHQNCDACGEVLHCCRMCRHYLPDKRPYCDHDRADPPVEKEQANFCDYFRPVNRFDSARLERSGEAKSELDALFGDDERAAGDSETEESDEIRNKLDDLFDD